MQESLLTFLRCPVTRTRLTLKKIHSANKVLDGKSVEVIDSAILFSGSDWFYPVIKGVPRLTVESVIDHKDFLTKNMPDYDQKLAGLHSKYKAVLDLAHKKNKRTKESFTQEWSIFDYDNDKTWDADEAGMIDRFLKETDETTESLNGKIIFDAGCGNGKLNILLAQKGVANIGMDFSNSIEKAYETNQYANAHFIQGDVQFPPVSFDTFDIVHSSGVLIATNNTELSFSCLEPTVKQGGKLSVWLYRKRKDFLHNLFNSIRKVSSRLPLRIQYYLYAVTIFPVGYIIKRIKGNKQNTREMMIDILDWFTPEFRWEHDQVEAKTWFIKRNYTNIRVTTDELFGFNIIGEKNPI